MVVKRWFCIAKNLENSAFSRLFVWRRRRDSNPRDAFDAYTISSRAPSTKLGDFSRKVTWSRHQRWILYRAWRILSRGNFRFSGILFSEAECGAALRFAPDGGRGRGHVLGAGGDD